MKNAELKQKCCKESKKTLEVMISPALAWDKQFSIIVGKLRDVVRKLNNAKMIITAASMHYKTHLRKNVYYGHGIFSVTSK